MTEQELLETEATHIVATGESSFVPEMPAVDWQDATVYHESVVAETSVTEERYDAAPVYAPRGKWDFTEPQRIIIGILLWLNIIVLTLAVLLLTGHFA